MMKTKSNVTFGNNIVCDWGRNFLIWWDRYEKISLYFIVYFTEDIITTKQR